MKPFPWQEEDKEGRGWTRGWWRHVPFAWTCLGAWDEEKANKGVFSQMLKGCGAKIGNLWYSPGRDCGVLCPKCAFEITREGPEEEFYLQWLEDQAEISDAETEPGIIRVHNNTPWRVCVDGLFIGPRGHVDMKADHVHAVFLNTGEGFVTWIQDGDAVFLRAWNNMGEPIA